tara:strand:- start:1275 stop:1841 length:567 start_codon:yes stop_codon:yes gene_type:complete
MSKINVFIYLIITNFFMFSFNHSAKSNYDKLFYDFSIKSLNGNNINLNNYRGKVILLVNLASHCGFTKQYNGLQTLWEKYKDKGLIVLGVPSQSFNQEKETEIEIKEFCEVNFNVNFPMTSIFDVKGSEAHNIYKWARNSFGKSAIPKWNFHKILINSNGKIEDTFAPFTKPMSKKITNSIEKLLNHE